MSAVNGLAYCYLAYLSQPASDRAVYRLIRRRRIRHIVEIGVGLGVRSLRMIRVAARSGQPVRYTGIDPFESRAEADGPGLSIKLAHKMLAPTGARVQLLPGTPEQALSRAANSLLGTDLLVFSSPWTLDSLGQSWPYVPRMLHAASVVLVEEQQPPTGKTWLRIVPPDEIQQRATTRRLRRAA